MNSDFTPHSCNQRLWNDDHGALSQGYRDRVRTSGYDRTRPEVCDSGALASRKLTGNLDISRHLQIVVWCLESNLSCFPTWKMLQMRCLHPLVDRIVLRADIGFVKDGG